MDKQLRELLRDTRSTAEECYWKLKRAGYNDSDTEEKLVNARKIPPEFGAYETLQVVLGELHLGHARRKVAEEAFQAVDFSPWTEGVVEAQDNWQFDNTSGTKYVYLTGPAGQDSIQVRYAVEFVPKTALIESDGVYTEEGDGDPDYDY